MGGDALIYSGRVPSDKGSGTAYLVETDLESGKSKRLAGFHGGKSATLVEHGSSPEAISIFDFSNQNPDCGRGKATPIAIRWAEQKVLPSFPFLYRTTLVSIPSEQPRLYRRAEPASFENSCARPMRMRRHREAD